MKVQRLEAPPTPPSEVVVLGVILAQMRRGDIYGCSDAKRARIKRRL